MFVNFLVMVAAIPTVPRIVPMKTGDVYFSQKATSTANCAFKLNTFYFLNGRTAGCSYSMHDPTSDYYVQVSDTGDGIVESYDADYWYPQEPAWTTRLDPIRGAKFKCRILKAWKGCSIAFLQEGLDGDWNMSCPAHDQDHIERSFVEIVGVPPASIAECRMRDETNEQAWALALMRTTERLSLRLIASLYNRSTGEQGTLAVPFPDDEERVSADAKWSHSRFHRTGSSASQD